MYLETCTEEELAAVLFNAEDYLLWNRSPSRHNSMEELFERELLPLYEKEVAEKNYSLETRSKVWKHLRNLLPDLIIVLKQQEKERR